MEEIKLLVNSVYIFNSTDYRESTLKLAVMEITETSIKTFNCDTNSVLRMPLEKFNRVWRPVEYIGEFNIHDYMPTPLLVIKYPSDYTEEMLANLRFGLKEHLKGYQTMVIPSTSRDMSVKAYFEKDQIAFNVKELEKILTERITSAFKGEEE